GVVWLRKHDGRTQGGGGRDEADCLELVSPGPRGGANRTTVLDPEEGIASEESCREDQTNLATQELRAWAGRSTAPIILLATKSSHLKGTQKRCGSFPLSWGLTGTSGPIGWPQRHLRHPRRRQALLNRGTVHNGVRAQVGIVVNLSFASSSVADEVANWKVEDDGVVSLSDHNYVRLRTSPVVAMPPPQGPNRFPRWCLTQMDRKPSSRSSRGVTRPPNDVLPGAEAERGSSQLVDSGSVTLVIEEEMDVAFAASGPPAPGPDGIPGRFPKSWKEGLLCLIRKEWRSLDAPSAYRPIILLNEIGNVFEKILADRPVGHLETVGPGLSVEQYGFRAESPLTPWSR
ncbi:jg23147, partial [Pararge aegeria aegeria]